MNKRTFSIITLGCPKNLVDSEVLKGKLEDQDLLYEEKAEAAQIVIINTCGFIESAREESIDTILEILELKRNCPEKKVLIAGCLAQRYPDQLRRELPELDGIYGVESYNQIARSIGNTTAACENVEIIRSLLTPHHFAYLKIAEGCDNRCSFCSIPLMRGVQKSRPVESLLREAEYLSNQGVKELILIAQDLTRYGSDLPKKTDLYVLLHELLALKRFPWVRLLYANPDFWDGKSNRLFQEYPELCPYLDIPIQHASAQILKQMERGSDVRKIKAKLRQLRRDVPDLALRTSFMVGFPNESDDDFNQLLDLIAEIRFERLGVFCYSQEEDTRAATLSDNIPAAEKENRRELIMQVQWSIARDFAESKIGQKVAAIVEKNSDGSYLGRTIWDAPEIDCVVKINSESYIPIGEIVTVTITAADGIDLVADY
jgi:ribosomal protein S12 methylthiotransferase